MAEANVVEQFRIGNTRIRIADNFVNPEETESILKRIAEIAARTAWAGADEQD